MRLFAFAAGSRYCFIGGAPPQRCRERKKQRLGAFDESRLLAPIGKGLWQSLWRSSKTRILFQFPEATSGGRKLPVGWSLAVIGEQVPIELPRRRIAATSPSRTFEKAFANPYDMVAA